MKIYKINFNWAPGGTESMIIVAENEDEARLVVDSETGGHHWGIEDVEEFDPYEKQHIYTGNYCC